MTTQKRNGQTERSLTESEELYRLLAEHSTDMISKHTPEGAYTYASRACRSLLGYEPEELVGHDAYEFFHPEDLQQIREAHSAILERSDTSTITYRIRCKEGSYIWFETTSKTIRDERAGEVNEIIAVSRDITERKQAEEKLRRSNRWVVSILESITEEFIALDTEWRYTYINERALHRIRRVKGEQLTREELLGRNAWEVYPEFVGSVFYRELHRALREHKPVQFEGYSPLSDRWFETHAYPSEDGLSVYSRDITERKRAEEQLRESEERLQRAIEIETVGVMFFRTDGSITDANDAFLGMSGYTREDLAKGLVRWDEMTPPEWMPHSLKAIEEFQSTGRTIPYEKEYVRKDGSRWWGLFAARRLDEHGGVEFIIDITESKRAEEELRFRKALLEAQTETSIDGILVVSPDRRLISYNRRFVEMWDIPEEILETRSDVASVEAVKHKIVDSQEFLERLNYLYEHRDEDSSEEIQLKDGRTFERYSAPVTGSDGTYYGRVFFVRDITRRKRAEESLLEVRKAERRRIARDLHDTVLQDLSGTLQGLQAVQVEFESAQQKVNLKQETDALRKAVGGLRGALHDLRDEKDQPFVKAIEALVEYNRQLTPERQVRLNVQEGFPQELPEAVKVELLRTVQEALANARQHSDAGWIGVKLYKPEEEKVCVQVVDDGLGFDPESVRRGLGLLGMHERIESFGGDLEIRSEAGKGTMVSVTVPTQALEDERGD